MRQGRGWRSHERAPALWLFFLPLLFPLAPERAPAGAGALHTASSRDNGDAFPIAGNERKKMVCVGAGKRANSHELNAMGVTHQQAGSHEHAEACYRAALKKKPDFIVALFNLGTLRLAQGDDRSAIAVFEEVVGMQPSYASAHYNMGSAYYRLGSAGQAIASFTMAVGADPNYVHAHANLATVLHMQGDLVGAKKHHQESIRIDPGFADGWMNLGNVLKEFGQVEAAIQSYATATTLRPDYSMAFYNLGVAHTSLSPPNHTAAVEAYRFAARHNPSFVNAHYNMGLSLQALGQLEAAASALAQASRGRGGLELSSYNNLGTVLDQLGRLPEAIQAYKTALKLVQEGDAAEASVLANLFNSLQAVCDWESTVELERRLLRLVEAVMRSETEAPSGLEPFHSVSYPFSAQLALQIARMHAWRIQTPADSPRPLFSLPSLLPVAAPKSLRVGYLVDGVRNGTLAEYLASLLASHDRHVVKTYVFLLQEPHDQTARAKVEALRDHSDGRLRNLAPVLGSGSPRGAANAAANVISSDAVHVLLDCSENGSGAGRHAILACQSAPIQVSVGFKSTQGAKYLQFFLSDAVMAPPEQSPNWSEKMLYLPTCGLVKDFDHSLKGVLSLPSARDPSLRDQFGLPPGVLFCSFGEAYKLDAAMLATWTRILKRTPGSTLWLPRYNALAEENLRVHLRELGVNESQFIFSPPTLRCLGGRCTRHNGKGSLVLSESEYLAASLAADIYLDNGPGLSSPLAMASLLWAAVPAVALAGERAVSRGSASLLLSFTGASACLVANTVHEYEELAVSLASRPEAVAHLRQMLRHERMEVFDTRAWTHKFERALLMSWDSFLATESYLHLRSAAIKKD